MEVQNGMYHQKKNGQHLEKNWVLRKIIMEAKGLGFATGHHHNTMKAPVGMHTSAMATWTMTMRTATPTPLSASALLSNFVKN